jgi:glycosyltransferase involved in cell wall biosynthesis
MKPRALYVSPVLPARTGNGLAIRAGNVLRALAEHYRVHLHVLPLYARWDEALVPELGALCEAVSEGPAVPTEPFDVAHVLRLAALPYARRAVAGERHVDLDDVEPRTYRRLAALHRLRGEEESARQMEAQARLYEPLQDEVLDSWQRVYVCSETDRAGLAGRTADVLVLPNVVELAPPREAARANGPFAFLFVGTLGYFPNEDAASWFRTAVLPELRTIAPGPFRVVVVGGDGPSEAEIEFAGQVPDVGPWYRRADAAIVPLRAGGGTRIKILEAFAHSVPVVSTPLGAEGLEVEDERHLLLAEASAEFARRCSELMANPALGRRLADEAYRLTEGAYSPAAAARAVAPSEAPPRSAAPADAVQRHPS